MLNLFKIAVGACFLSSALLPLPSLAQNGIGSFPGFRGEADFSVNISSTGAVFELNAPQAEFFTFLAGDSSGPITFNSQQQSKTNNSFLVNRRFEVAGKLFGTPAVTSAALDNETSILVTNPSNSPVFTSVTWQLDVFAEGTSEQLNSRSSDARSEVGIDFLIEYPLGETTVASDSVNHYATLFGNIFPFPESGQTLFSQGQKSFFLDPNQSVLVAAEVSAAARAVVVPTPASFVFGASGAILLLLLGLGNTFSGSFHRS